MVRPLGGSLLVFLVWAAGVPAAEVRGKLKSVDAAKGVITLTVGDKERAFTVTKDTDMLVQDIRPYKPKDRLKDPVFKRKGLQVVVTTKKKDGKEVAAKIVIYTGRKG
jgi:hypothetical protein